MIDVSNYLSAIPNPLGWDIDINAAHKRLWEGFNGHLGTAPFQFRIDEDHSQILVRSSVEPVWKFEARTIEEVFRLYEGLALDVDVVVNPVVRLARQSTERFLKAPEDLVNFVNRKAQAAGLAVATDWFSDEADDLDPQPLVSLWGMDQIRVVPSSGAPFPLYLKRAKFIAEVVDPDKTAHAIRTGIGRKKRYGCGMLLALPVR